MPLTNFFIEEKPEEKAPSELIRKTRTEYDSKCSNCAKPYTEKNPDFWEAYGKIYLKERSHQRICTRCAVRGIIHQEDYFSKKEPELLALAKRVKKKLKIPMY